jgi:hypothetical protein
MSSKLREGDRPPAQVGDAGAGRRATGLPLGECDGVSQCLQAVQTPCLRRRAHGIGRISLTASGGRAPRTRHQCGDRQKCPQPVPPAHQPLRHYISISALRRAAVRFPDNPAGCADRSPAVTFNPCGDQVRRHWFCARLWFAHCSRRLA